MVIDAINSAEGNRRCPNRLTARDFIADARLTQWNRLTARSPERYSSCDFPARDV